MDRFCLWRSHYSPNKNERLMTSKKVSRANTPLMLHIMDWPSSDLPVMDRWILHLGRPNHNGADDDALEISSSNLKCRFDRKTRKVGMTRVKKSSVSSRWVSWQSKKKGKAIRAQYLSRRTGWTWLVIGAQGLSYHQSRPPKIPQCAPRNPVWVVTDA